MDFKELCMHMVPNREQLQFLNSGLINTFERLGIELPDFLKCRMIPKECYSNAAKVAQYLSYATDFDVYYAEGITSVFGDIPIYHAFIIIEVEGINWIVDPTMEYALEKSDDEIFSEKYVLIKMWPGSEVNDLMLKHRKWGPWADNN